MNICEKEGGRKGGKKDTWLGEQGGRDTEGSNLERPSLRDVVSGCEWSWSMAMAQPLWNRLIKALCLVL